MGAHIVTDDEVKKAILDGASPALLGQLAHHILDYVELTGEWWVKTPRHDWHVATERELDLIQKRELP
jgi:hypothetical protein